MMKRIQTLGVVCSMLFASGCGASPLFHHVDAADRHHDGESPTPNEAACPLEFPQAGLCASWTWVILPTEEEEGRAFLQFWNKATGTEAGSGEAPADTVYVKLYMPSMGHGSAPTTVSNGPRVGMYDVSRISFSMPGEWEVKVQLRREREVIEEAKFSYRH